MTIGELERCQHAGRALKSLIEFQHAMIGGAVAVVGSRDFTEMWLVRYAVRLAVNVGAMIVSGGARGVDTVAAVEAQRLGGELLVYPALWERDGRSAGYRRNRVIIDSSTCCVAFHARGSRGTAHSISLARQADLPLLVIEGPTT